MLIVLCYIYFCRSFNVHYFYMNRYLEQILYSSCFFPHFFLVVSQFIFRPNVAIRDYVFRERAECEGYGGLIRILDDEVTRKRGQAGTRKIKRRAVGCGGRFRSTFLEGNPLWPCAVYAKRLCRRPKTKPEMPEI